MTEDTTTAQEVQPVDPAVEQPIATATFVEDADTGVIEEAPTQSHPDTIQMQPEDPAPPELEVTQPGNELPAEEPAVMPEPEPVPAATGGAPKVSEINAEMAAGAARVQEHQNRERMLATKRNSDVPEEQQVSEATAINKDL